MPAPWLPLGNPAYLCASEDINIRWPLHAQEHPDADSFGSETDVWTSEAPGLEKRNALKSPSPSFRLGIRYRAQNAPFPADASQSR